MAKSTTKPMTKRRRRMLSPLELFEMAFPDPANHDTPTEPDEGNERPINSPAWTPADRRLIAALTAPGAFRAPKCP